jgi:predicted RNase H-like HicB family nuclease
VATGYTIEEVKKEIKDAIIFYLKGLEIEGLPIPQPTAISEYVEV